MEKIYPNHFVHGRAAQRYTASRPYFHPQVIERMRVVLGLRAKVESALDVGCGTGQSTRALQAIAERVVGVDPSRAMLDEVPAEWGLTVLEGRGEALPIADASVDLVTAGLAFHWMKRAQFLPEARRVLRPGGHLVIYNNGISGRMLDRPEFARWNAVRVLKSVPIPPRYRYPLKDAQAERHGLAFLARETYENTVELGREELAEYLLTQSNVIAELEGGAHGVDELRARVSAELEPLFPVPRISILFGGSIWYLVAR